MHRDVERSIANPTPHAPKTILLLLMLLIVPIYAHVGGASWQLDDRPNIVDNQKLHIKDWMPSSLLGVCFANQGKGGHLFRPVANLSFALNWYLGKNNPAGYRWCNIALHILTAFLLYVFIVAMGRTPRLCQYLPAAGWHFAAGLTASLWAVHPIQIQAVTYIVQRMTILATFFYLLGMYAYLKVRLAETLKRRWAWAAAGTLCFLLAVGSKENAILLPGTLVLLELVCFQDLPRVKRYLPKLLPPFFLGLLLMLLGALFFLQFDPVGFFERMYSERPFSLYERLLTQSRIILFYLSLILFPSPNRFSIVHDVTLSQTLLRPWYTLPAILLVVALAGFGLYFLWRRRLIALAILFFLLNHVVESSILPLELVFEHRNYLPSLFIFLPVTVSIWRLLERFKNNYRWRYLVVSGLSVLWVLALGIGTYVRNMDWLTEERLWSDAAVKAPNNARPLNNLAIRLAWSDHPSPEQYARAFVWFRKSLDMDVAREPLRAEIVGNMASILYHTGQYEEAIKLYGQSLQINPGFAKGRADLVKVLILAGRWNDALQQCERLVAEAPAHPDYLNLRGFVHMWQGNDRPALVDFRKSVALNPGNSGVWMNIGVVLSRLGSYPNGEWFLRQAIKITPGDLHPRLAMVENALRAGDYYRAENETRQLMALFPLPAIRNYLGKLSNEKRFAPVAADIVAPFIDQKMAMACQ